ncbi:GGDEF domain-containing protein [Nitrincola alkalilacustris]|uniref:GGDEF domain-containing protein n=1 Tax=Nitrincola alkalilacustris TaxID=1571224 RepID=UPI00124DDCFF|nr:GGDEF domain-containing protein [Nitrincola alkalilacustris]
MSFSIVLIWVTYEVRWFYPEMQRYFGDAGTLAGQQLATRSRTYIQNSLEALGKEPLTEETLKQVKTNLDLAYGFLDIGLYRERYECTESSLALLDDFDLLFNKPDPPDSTTSLAYLLPVIQCATVIEIGQWNRRSVVAMDMVESIDWHQRVFLWGTILFYVIGIGFWWMHEKQRRAFMQSIKDKLKWMQQALEDPLTGAHNRRALDSDLLSHLAQFKRGARPFSLVMCDIDYFKSYNDAFGHADGDEALKKVVSAMTKTLRASDRIYRYGGEELAIILPDTEGKEAMDVAMRAIEAVEALDITNPDSPYGKLTISAGLASAAAEIEESDTLIRLADEKLYEAKSTGKNRLAVAWI